MKIAIVDPDIKFAHDLQREFVGGMNHCSLFLSWSIFHNSYNQDFFDVIIINCEVSARFEEEIRDWLYDSDSLFVIVVKSRITENDVTTWLEAGANDLVVKPLDPRMLATRVKALARGSVAADRDKALQFGSYRFDPRSRSVTSNGEQISLTEKEFALSLLLFRNFGRALSRDDIFCKIWENRTINSSRTVDTHISRIRKKMKLLPGSEFPLISLYGKGYMIVGQDDAFIDADAPYYSTERRSPSPPLPLRKSA